MRYKPNRRQIYFRLEDKLAQKLDKRIARAGYKSRIDFFTAVSYVAIYGEEWQKIKQTDDIADIEGNLPKTVSTWLENTIPQASEEHIQAWLQAIIKDMLFPVIAMKGVDIAFEATVGDVRNTFHQQHGIWVTESDLREAYTSFAAIHKAELEHYRQTQLTGNEDKP